MLDYVPGSALIEVIHKVGPIDEEGVRVYFDRLTSAVHHMHSNNIVHCDLKPENILFDSQTYDL